MITTIGRELAKTSTTFRKDSEHRDQRGRGEEIEDLAARYEEEIEELSKVVAEANAARDKAIKERDERPKPEEVKRLRDQLRASELRELELMREAQGLRAAIGVCRSNCTDFGTRHSVLTGIRPRSEVAQDVLDQGDDAGAGAAAGGD